tara:strand:+ start:2260 stop:2541 length:282 start_codon:yes stop_codon:yes gene_type:complete
MTFTIWMVEVNKQLLQTVGYDLNIASRNNTTDLVSQLQRLWSRGESVDNGVQFVVNQVDGNSFKQAPKAKPERGAIKLSNRGSVGIKLGRWKL